MVRKTHENVKSDHIEIYVKLHSCITDSKREDEDPKWNIHRYLHKYFLTISLVQLLLPLYIPLQL
jgi:hypothetical protein